MEDWFTFSQWAESMVVGRRLLFRPVAPQQLRSFQPRQRTLKVVEPRLEKHVLFRHPRFFIYDLNNCPRCPIAAVLTENPGRAK
jgi:hypothetical protein